ncbi:MAG: extradiol ring-cleavage dioxygenase, partial [Streptomyces sp.]
MSRPPVPQPPIARLRALRSVELLTPSFTEAADFYQEVWGLETVEAERGRAAWLRGTGAEHHALQLTRADRVGLGRISFAVGTP